MKKEIEKKFLVLDLSYKQLSIPQHYIQGYIANSQNPIMRIRTIEEKSYIALKNHISGITSIEYEYEIPNQDAKELLKLFCQDTIIEKYRYKIQYQGTLWEIDEFLGDNKGLIIAEVELATENSQFHRPNWIGQEVSNDEKYYNYNLSKKPYNQW